MAHSRSAKKRIRQQRKHHLRNLVRKERVKKALRAFSATVQKGDAAAVEAGLRTAHRALDKAGTKGILHRKTVDRRKGRLARTAHKRRMASSSAT
ncbi:MAG: 30S ribosomal protein S20 [Planctomycetota bacterium]